MKHPNAVSLAKRLLDSHIKRQVISGIESETEHLFRITNEERAWAEEILATHLDACMKHGIHPDLTEAVADALAFALRGEKAYEPIPKSARLRHAFVVMEEQDAD
jgi:hypothetical protein